MPDGRASAMNFRPHLFHWIGLCGGLVGVLILKYAPLDDLLPINQVLFSIVCGLFVVWALVTLTSGYWKDR